MGAPGAVVIGGYVNGLGVVRALASGGVRTAVIRTKPYDIAHRSKWVAAHRTVGDLHERSDGLVEVLERNAAEWNGWALVPTNDEALAALGEYGERLASSYRIAAPPPDAIRYLLDKRLMMEAAQAVGIDTPHVYGPADTATAMRGDLRFPVVVKPLVAPRFAARFGAKLGVAHDRGELDRWIADMERTQIPGLVLDLVPGPDSAIYPYCAYLDQSGAPVAGRQVRKLRQTPAGFGDARVAEVIDEHAGMREATVEIARRIGLRGMVIAEFKRDPRDGRLRLFDVNGRSVVYNGLLRRAGLDLAGLTWRDHMGEAPRANGSRDWRGVWIHLYPDLLRSAVEWRRDRMGLAKFLAPYRRPKVEAVWSVHDPLPFVTQWAQTLTDSVRFVAPGDHRPELPLAPQIELGHPANVDNGAASEQALQLR
jgi:predicted ATP-grasp superfamily ATP-dependent carboligase